MSRRASRAKLCPTPSKGRYFTEAEAIDAGLTRQHQMTLAHQPVKALYVYPCPCLWWHLTSRRYSSEGQWHRAIA